MKRKRFYKKLILLLVTALISGSLAPWFVMKTQAAGRVLTLDMAKKSGLANSPDYEKLENELSLKEVSLKQAVKSIQAKQKNMATFRWTPLLSFKFPEKPDLSEAFEFQFKPVQIQAQIDTTKHKLTDQVFAVYEEVSNLYVDIVVLEDTISFNEQRLEAMEETLAKNRLRLKTGEATQSDIDTMEKAVEALNRKISSDRISLTNRKAKLSKVIGMDVTTGYTFENPFVDVQISQSQLAALTRYTLDHDQNYYEVSMNATTARISVQTNYQLMSGQYGGKMNMISSYVNQALAGQKIDGKAFKKSYDEFLVAIDAPWQGTKKILFIKIPKEWFKGSIDGIRYVEDEPYALYESSLEYLDAVMEKENTADELEEQVKDAYNNLVSMRRAYMSLVESASSEAKQLEADRVLNSLGEMTYAEYKDSLDSYEDTQNEMFEALATYSQTLYSFDRLTCGGVTELLKGTSAELNAGIGGRSYVEEEYADGAYYYIEPIIQEQEFRLGVSIPDDFDIDISHFELWCDNMQIGERTEVDKTLRHLALSADNVTEVKLRFYDGDRFIDDCVIDPDVYSGPLQIIAGYNIVRTENREIGSYTSEISSVTGLAVIGLKPNAAEQIAYYRIQDAAGNYLVSDALIPVGTEIQYPSLVLTNMEDLTIEFYGEDSQLKYTGYFDTVNHRLMKIPV